MWWVRLFCLVAPLAVVSAGWWLWGKIDQLSVETPTELVVAVSVDPGELNPLMPSSGTNREITDLIFERLFRRDDEMLMRGHLAETWELRQQVSYFFRDAQAATAAAALLEKLLEAADPRWSEWGARSVEQDGQALRVWLSGHDSKAAHAIDDFFNGVPATKEQRLALTQIQLRVRDSARESFGLFQREAIEAGQIRHVIYDDSNQRAVISAAGEVDLFQRELQLYYEANQNLEPQLEALGSARFVTELEVRLFLKDGVRWHDGMAFSANDVVFSFLEVARPGSNSPLKPWFSSVIAVQAVAPREVRIAMREPYAPLMESWEALPMLPAHLLSTSALGADGVSGDIGGGVVAPAEWAKFYTRPVGTGPYAVADRDPGKSLTLRAFQEYFRGSPMQQEVRYVVIKDREKRAMALRLGQVDVLRADDLERVTLRADERFEEIDGVPRLQTFVAWNLRREPLVDARVRTALAQLVDVRSLIQEFAGPESRPCRGIFYPDLWLCPEDVKIPEFDVEKGLALLAKAGWKAASEQGDGNQKNPPPLINAQGEAFSFRLLVAGDDREQLRLAAALVSGWRSHGVGAELVVRPWSEVVGEALALRDFDALLLNWELGFRRDQSVLWHSSEADVETGGGNFSGLRNQIVDDLLGQLKTETDPEQVRELAVGLQELLWTLQPCMFLHESGEVVMVRRDLLNEARPMMDGSRSIQEITVPPSGLSETRPWWVKNQSGR